MKKTISILIAVAVLLLIVVRLKGNHDKINSNKASKPELSTVSVSVAKVSKMELRPELNLVGSLVPFTEVDIPSEAQGVITMLNAELGQSKTKGSIIATIDSKLKQLAVNTAKNSVDKLKRDLDRYKNLYEGGSATKQQVDDTQSSYDNAVLQLEQAEKQLADATVKSPADGIITQKSVEKGSFVNVGSRIATLTDISKLKTKLNVSEANIYQLKLNDRANITTSVYPGVEFTGTISYISPKGDDSHNYAVEIVIQNSKANPLKAGTFINAQFKLPNKTSALYIPREAMQGSVKAAKVYVAENGKAVLRDIVVGSGSDKLLEVLSGLAEGEQVITTGQINLSEGKAVSITN